ncbi:DNA-directed RNA polymerase sigma-70 factor [Bacteroidia bacterium]|nr:DNA-directed RNA polymerase sigma-70 factor [Bacteroidia bacterium]
MKRLLKLSDAEILQRYKQTENSEYLTGLYARYIPLIYGVCLKYLYDTRKAQEAVKQIYKKLLPTIAQQEIEDFRTWIYSVTLNYCHAESIISTQEAKIIKSLNTDFSNIILKKCFKQLPVEQRIALIRFFEEEMSYEDIVSSLRYELNQVKSLIRKGIDNLANCME